MFLRARKVVFCFMFFTLLVLGSNFYVAEKGQRKIEKLIHENKHQSSLKMSEAEHLIPFPRLLSLLYLNLLSPPPS